MASIISTFSKEDLILLCNECETLSDILKAIGLPPKGNNFKTLKKYLDQHEIDYSNLKNNAKHRRVIKIKEYQRNKKISLEMILVENSNYNRGRLKTQLIQENLLNNKCALCGITNKWNDKDLILQLDHINGISNDNRIENLRLLCPNCHSQTETFAGRSSKRPSKKYYCQNCGIEIARYSKKCRQCNGKDNRKVERPSKEDLETLLKNESMLSISKKFGVSDNTIKRWAKLYKLI